MLKLSAVAATALAFAALGEPVKAETWCCGEQAEAGGQSVHYAAVYKTRSLGPDGVAARRGTWEPAARRISGEAVEAGLTLTYALPTEGAPVLRRAWHHVRLPADPTLAAGATGFLVVVRADGAELARVAEGKLDRWFAREHEQKQGRAAARNVGVELTEALDAAAGARLVEVEVLDDRGRSLALDRYDLDVAARDALLAEARDRVEAKLAAPQRLCAAGWK